VTWPPAGAPVNQRGIGDEWNMDYDLFQEQVLKIIISVTDRPVVLMPTARVLAGKYSF
jgi:hypothetical protein